MRLPPRQIVHIAEDTDLLASKANVSREAALLVVTLLSIGNNLDDNVHAAEVLSRAVTDLGDTINNGLDGVSTSLETVAHEIKERD
jgi:hypothetical protein